MGLSGWFHLRSIPFITAHRQCSKLVSGSLGPGHSGSHFFSTLLMAHLWRLWVPSRRAGNIGSVASAVPGFIISSRLCYKTLAAQSVWSDATLQAIFRNGLNPRLQGEKVCSWVKHKPPWRYVMPGLTLLSVPTAWHYWLCFSYCISALENSGTAVNLGG